MALADFVGVRSETVVDGVRGVTERESPPLLPHRGLRSAGLSGRDVRSGGRGELDTRTEVAARVVTRVDGIESPLDVCRADAVGPRRASASLRNETLAQDSRPQKGTISAGGRATR